MRRIRPAFCMSAAIASATPGYWILTATAAPVGQHRAVHLADRGGRRGLVLEVLEQLLAGLVPLLVEHLAHLLPRHRRRLGAQLGELLLVELAVLGRQELGVDERGELADLHRRALHAPERLDHALGGLEVAALERVGGLLGRARQVAPRACRRSARPACRPPSPTWAVRRILPLGIELSSPAGTPLRIGRRSATLAGRMADGKRPTLRGRRAPRARHPRHQGACAARASCPASSTAAADGDCVSFKVDARVLRQVLVDGSALIDLQVDGNEAAGDRQGPAARPGARRDHPHRPARGPPRREDPDAGRRRISRASRRRRASRRAACSTRSPTSSTSRRCRPRSPRRSSST